MLLVQVGVGCGLPIVWLRVCVLVTGEVMGDGTVCL